MRSLLVVVLGFCLVWMAGCGPDQAPGDGAGKPGGPGEPKGGAAGAAFRADEVVEIRIACEPPKEPAGGAGQGEPPAQALHLDLWAGNAGNPIRVFVDGRKVCDQPARTDPGLGVPDSCSTTVPGTAIQLMVKIPSRGVTRVFKMDLSKGAWLMLGVEPGNIRMMRQRAQPFLYD
jgi:hypothetical protein